MTDEEKVVNKLKDKIKEKGFYGEIEDKPPTEQELFSLQTKLFVERKEYKRDYEVYQKKLKEICDRGEVPNIDPPEDKSKQTWSDMLEIMYQYTRSCILKRNKKKRFMEPEDVTDKAISAALSFMSQYNKNPDFYVGASFAGMVKWKIVEALYKYQAEDNHVSLNQVISDEGPKEIGENMTYEDNAIPGSYSDYGSPEDVILAESNEDLVTTLVGELDEMVGHSSKYAFLARLYLLIILRGPKTRHSKRLFLEQWASEHQMEQVLEATILELHQRMKENCIS